MNVLDPGQLGPWAALVAGFAGSGHCLAMCGGIAGALAMRGHAMGGARESTVAFAPRLALALSYNLARLTSYALAGALAGLLGQALLRAVDVASLSLAMRVLAGLVMVAAAGRLLFGWRLLDPLEAAGSRLWRRVLPWASPLARRGSPRVNRRDSIAGAVALGLAWGWLPCGLTYSMLLLAATTTSPATGAVVMAAFGLGTLPAMVSATVAFDRAARLLASRATLRTVAGALLLAFGAWTAGNAAYHAAARSGHEGHSMHSTTPDAVTPDDVHAGHLMPATADPAPSRPTPVERAATEANDR